MKDSIYKQILKDCFWEYDFTIEDIKRLAKSSKRGEREFLFQKILLNSTSLIQSMKIFDREILIEMIRDYKIPKFNQDYIKKRKNMLEIYFLDMPPTANEFKWIA